MYKYKTKGNAELVIPGLGTTVSGEISSPYPIENPNLELVESPVENKSAHMNGVVHQNEQPAAPSTDQPTLPTAESEQQ